MFKGQFCDDLERSLGQAADGWMPEESDGKFVLYVKSTSQICMQLCYWLGVKFIQEDE